MSLRTLSSIYSVKMSEESIPFCSVISRPFPKEFLRGQKEESGEIKNPGETWKSMDEFAHRQSLHFTHFLSLALLSFMFLWGNMKANIALCPIK